MHSNTLTLSLALALLLTPTSAASALDPPVDSDPGPEEFLEELVDRTLEYVQDFDPGAGPNEQWNHTRDYLLDVYQETGALVLNVVCVDFVPKPGIDFTWPPKIEIRNGLRVELPAYGTDNSGNPSWGVLVIGVFSNQGCDDSDLPILERWIRPPQEDSP